MIFLSLFRKNTLKIKKAKTQLLAVLIKSNKFDKNNEAMQIQ